MTNNDTAQETSEFGKGLCYCLALFLEHKHLLHSRFLEPYQEMREKHAKDSSGIFDEKSAVSLWFSGASDHFFDMIPNKAPTNDLQGRCATLRNKCLFWRMPLKDNDWPSKDDAEWAIKEAEELLRLIDEAHGIPTLEAQWK